MHVIVITGAPGIGKTAVLPRVVELLPEKAAFLDGDCIGRTCPTQRTLERLNLIQDNIRACADNFARWGADNLVTGFVFPSAERVQRITDILRSAGHAVSVVALVAEEATVLCRHKKKSGDHSHDAECLAEAIRCNTSIRNLDGVEMIDTTHMTLEQMVSAIVQAASNNRLEATLDSAPQP